MPRRPWSVVLRAARKLLLRYAPPELVIFMRHVSAQPDKILARRKVYIAAQPEAGPVLVLAPHQDDEVIGMGGTISRHLAQSDPVTVLFLTDGGGIGGNREKTSAARRREAESIGAGYGIRQIFWDNMDTRLTNDAATVAKMVTVLKKLRPKTIYLPSFFDTHFDHFATNAVVLDALAQVESYHPILLGYEVWDEIPFPNYAIDISDHFARKTEMLRHYSTPLKTRNFIDLCIHRNALRYVVYIYPRGQGYAETFHRLDSDTYRALFADYRAALETGESQLTARLTSRAASAAV